MSLYFTLQKLSRQPQRITQRLLERGPLELSKWFAYQLQWRLRERRLGIDTLEHAYGINVYGKDGGQYYDPIDYRCLDRILDFMAPDPDRDVFLDYGAGLGRPVIAAAERPFRRVIGIENNELCLELCRRHVASAQKSGRLRCEIEIVSQDAQTYQVPPEVNKVLIYNAFVEQSLSDRVLEQIRRSLLANPRDLTLVFVPLHRHADFLESCPWLSLQCELDTGFWDHVKIMVYRPSLDKLAVSDAAESIPVVASISSTT
jgi:SAM-dependent methyltransferase